MHNFMVDLETLDTGTSAVILSVGIVPFDPTSSVIGEGFYVELNDDRVLAQQTKLGRTVSQAAVDWWKDQTKAARTLFEDGFGNRVTDLHDGLGQIAEFIMSELDNNQNEENVKIWGNGAAFDNVILRTLFEDAGIDPPWKFYNDRCFRTMKNLPGTRFTAPKFEGVAHNALDDAMHQAHHLLEIYRCLRPTQ